MQNRRNRVILTISILLVVLVGILAFIQGKSTGPSISLTPTPTLESPPRSIPVPLVSPVKNQQKSVTFHISIPPTSLPTALPIYTTTKPDTLAIARLMAQALHFPSEPTVIKGVHTGYDWTDAQRILTAQEDPPAISFQQHLDPSTKPISQENAPGVVENFIKTFFSIPSPFALTVAANTPLSVVNSNIIQAPSVSSAALVGVTHIYTINSVPLYQQTGSPATVSSLVGPGDVIQSISIALPPRVRSSTSAPLFTLVDAIALLKTQGILISINNTSQTYDLIPGTSFSEVNIQSVSLAFLFISTTQTLKPVFIFSGIVTNGNENSKGSTVTYMVPATAH